MSTSINDDMSICSLCDYIILNKSEGWTAESSRELYCSDSGNIHIPKTDGDYGKSRFDSVLAEILNRLSMDAAEDEEYYYASMEWAGLFLDFHAILFENDQGFVTVGQFDSKEATQKFWNIIIG